MLFSLTHFLSLSLTFLHNSHRLTHKLFLLTSHSLSFLFLVPSRRKPIANLLSSSLTHSLTSRSFTRLLRSMLKGSKGNTVVNCFRFSGWCNCELILLHFYSLLISPFHSRSIAHSALPRAFYLSTGMFPHIPINLQSFAPNISHRAFSL